MAPGTIAPYALALGRWALAGALLGVVARRELWAQRRAIAADWHHYVVLGFCGMLVCGAWVYLGARTTGAMNIALIYAASPVLIAVGSVLWLGERFRPAQALGVAVALAGVVHVIVQGRWLALAQVQWVVGDLWIVAAMVSWAAYALLQKLWPSPLGSTARLAAICWGGVLVLLPCAAWEALQPDTPAWSARAVALVVAAALAPGVMAYWMYGAAQKVLGASRVSYQPALLGLRDSVPELEGIVAEETALFNARSATLRQSTAALTERVRQADAVIDGRSRQLKASRREIALIHEELDAQESLLAK
eukprot:gene21984-21944_t